MGLRVNLLCIGLLFVGAVTAHAEVITSAGSTTVQPALKACAKAYQKQHAQTQIIIAGGGSSKGVLTVGKARVDMGAASRQIKAKELAQFPDLKTYKLGTDGVVMVVHASNSINGLSSKQVEQLFNGELSNWQQVGGADAKVSLISLGMEHGTYELFTHSFHLTGEESKGNILFKDGAAWIAFSQDVALDKLALNKDSITFASIGVAEAYAAKTGNVKLLALDGVAATEDNVVKGSYPLVRPLLLLTKGEAKGEVKSFIDYALSPACQSLVKEMGYIPVKR